MCFIPVETQVVCKAASHIEWHKHLVDTDTEHGGKFTVHINLYLPILVPTHVHIWQSTKESDEPPGRTSKSKNIYMQIISLYICNKWINVGCIYLPATIHPKGHSCSAEKVKDHRWCTLTLNMLHVSVALKKTFKAVLSNFWPPGGRTTATNTSSHFI